LSTWRAGRALPPLASASVALDRPIAAPRFVIDRSRAESLGWTAGPPLDRSLVPWVVRLERPVTGETLERARGIAASSAGASVDAARLLQRPARALYRFVLLAGVFAGCVVVLVATSLNAVESAADTRVLRAVGTAPRVLRGFAAARAGYVAALGCALAVPAGVLPAVALFTSVNVPLEFVVPWRDLAVITFALPAALYAWVWIRGETAVERASYRGAS
jgi:hypothetical protein